MSEPTPDDGLVEVRTTQRPWQPLRVTETERQHLLNEGLLEEQVQIAEQVAATTTPPPATTSTTKQKER